MNIPGLMLREGGLPDLDAVMTVMTGSFDPHYGEAWTAAQCSALLNLPGVWLTLAILQGEPAGFALARNVADEAELLLLAVKSEAQHRGIGKLLLRRFCEIAMERGADNLHLEVREGNRAVDLYRRAGFYIVGRRKNYYNGYDGLAHDALTLQRKISGKENVPS